jgi:acetyltransferase-like isoleucine patch superfamily enzyme
LKITHKKRYDDQVLEEKYQVTEEPRPVQEAQGIGLGKVRTQKTLADERLSPLEKYRLLVSGPGNFFWLLAYELITLLFGSLPGLLGLGLRQVFYPLLFRRTGKGLAIGRNVTLRHPKRIQIGHQVVIEEGVVLDAKGETGEGIIIGDGAFIGRGTILTARNGTLEIGPGSSISSYCRISSAKLGRKVLIAAYVYVVSGGHATERVDIPIIDQPSLALGNPEIEDGCWIGAFTAVIGQVRIGHDTIVGAHSLVNKDLPALAVAFGAPAQVNQQRTAGA